MSIRHRRVSPLMWDDPWFVDQSDAMRNLWQLILTGPQVLPIPGLQLAGPGSLAETLRRGLETVSELFGKLLGEGKVEFDSKCRMLRVPQAPKYNAPDNPNQVKGWWKTWQSLPESRLKYDHLEALKAAVFSVEGKGGKGCRDAWAKTFGTVQVTVPPTVSEQRVGSRDQGVGSREIPPGGDEPSQPPVLTNPEPEPPKARKPRQVPLPVAKVPVSVGWEVWREVYAKSRRAYGAYTESPGDGRTMTKLVDHATKLVRENLQGLGMGAADPTPNVRKVLRHWFIEYLRDNGNNGFLADKKHSLRFFENSIPEYGMPHSDERPAAPVAPPEPIPASVPGSQPSGFDATLSTMFATPGGVN